MAAPVFIVTFRPPRTAVVGAPVIPTVAYRVDYRLDETDAISDAAVAAAREYPDWLYLHCRVEVQIPATVHHHAQRAA
jgi:hypothetical protein